MSDRMGSTLRVAIALWAGIAAAAIGTAEAAAVRTGLVGTAFPANDDESVGPVGLGFSINFFG
ncbi:MAG: hypothetical protein K2Q06_12140, partial [Parvularculaceae bacterium]|nr:hypothetical protein [Parvularculaceae bacterium]